jgi:hypothetical protein
MPETSFQYFLSYSRHNEDFAARPAQDLADVLETFGLLNKAGALIHASVRERRESRQTATLKI